ncbi:putative transmembrane protein [Gregarina niphandrodes]|uniref:Transmembrane protein n=1 Tax=Gregarina niphandrodes TaxID=110365 RepID=A0A023B8C8_GRENI|nr:putative transmembrane protein [Gregarina niphandrodes]EZG68469.1 putative transmembrane protein [Gregarina niphandrodes]|eukprot:XP_011134574.1 putative transmembrane protein [Gregarina niphandrodes]
MSKQSFGRARDTGWIYIHEISSFTEHPLFKLPLEDGVYEGRLEERVDASAGDSSKVGDPSKVNIALGCDKRFVKIKELEKASSCWDINTDLTMDNVSDDVCLKKAGMVHAFVRGGPLEDHVRDKLRRDYLTQGQGSNSLLLVSVFNFAAFLVWLSIVVAGFAVFQK